VQRTLNVPRRAIDRQVVAESAFWSSKQVGKWYLSGQHLPSPTELIRVSAAPGQLSTQLLHLFDVCPDRSSSFPADPPETGLEPESKRCFRIGIGSALWLPACFGHSRIGAVESSRTTLTTSAASSTADIEQRPPRISRCKEISR
jgi:hypothetical protein